MLALTGALKYYFVEGVTDMRVSYHFSVRSFKI